VTHKASAHPGSEPAGPLGEGVANGSSSLVPSTEHCRHPASRVRGRAEWRPRALSETPPHRPAPDGSGRKRRRRGLRNERGRRAARWRGRLRAQEAPPPSGSPIAPSVELASEPATVKGSGKVLSSKNRTRAKVALPRYCSRIGAVWWPMAATHAGASQRCACRSRARG
jgi:hypothetical protein